MLAKAQKTNQTGPRGKVLKHTDLLSCPDTTVTAETFVSYLRDNLRLDTPHLLPKITKPTLVVVAGDDEVAVGLDKKVVPLADGKRMQMKIIDGADHFFRDLYADEAGDAIDAFLTGAGY